MSETFHTLINSSYPEEVVVEGDFPLDRSVVAVFPAGTKFLSAVRYNISAWTITARLVSELPNGCKEQYFIKCASEELGRIMMEGEFIGMSELHKTMPNYTRRCRTTQDDAELSPEATLVGKILGWKPRYLLLCAAVHRDG
jgi:protein-ribulosamine 3-kinase